MNRLSRILFFFLPIFGLMMVHVVVAQQPLSADSIHRKTGFIDGSVQLAENVMEALTFEKGRNSIAVIPVLGYSPQTGLEYGVMPVWRILPKPQPDGPFYRPTVLSAYILFSTTGMFELDFDLDAFLWQKYRLTAQTRGLYLPDKFYGVGNQSADADYQRYDARRFQFKGSFARQLGTPWFVGLYADVEETRNSPAVWHNGGTVAGSDGGFLFAIGPTAAFDSRNSATFPTQGWYARTWFLASEPTLGSDFDYSQVNFDGRCFLMVGKGVLANQFQLASSRGDVPFYRMAALGGKRGLRGIPHPLKYIDNNMWLIQSEYRHDLWWRLGAAVFGGMGQVANTWAAPFENIKWTTGAGLRFNIFPKEKLNCRFDFGVASGGDHAFYFSLNESF
jgi:outer membrane protein assembly factor BamA